ncbi:MAG TPA: selenium-dependent xanthine dehydrogenase [Candidatus Limnocylindria bacterium]|nr:selenium-dependent xanthine dehydrogenase [Candidatus Limnocylindria bacterium]
MRMTLNGAAREARVRADASLLDVLRDGFGLRSMKDGCAPEGSCGACTVIVDGRAVVSCAQPASRFEGREVLTLEGLDADARRAWADAFVAAGASQCGYCSPGIVMKAEALLRRTPRPSRAEVARALAGNLCRCTGYIKILDAVEAVASARADGTPLRAAPDADSGQIGAPALRYEGREQVLGERAFVADMLVPGMLHGALRFSDHPRAVVRRIDTSAAEQVPGVIRVVTWRDVPGDRFVGLITPDWPVFVAEGETTRYVGDVLAAVAADTREAAREAADRIEVEYDVLPPVTDPLAALKPDAPAIHPGGNLLSSSVVRRGDVDAALAASAHVVSDTFATQRIEHAFLEPEAALAVPKDGVMRVYSQGQGAWEDRRQIASLLALPESCVRVTQVPVGGAFGGKEDLSVQGQAAMLALDTGRPVLLRLTRHESLRLHPKRHPMTMEYTVGADADGHLTAVRARIVGDTGAYASVGAKVLERAAGHACGAYRVPNVDVESRAVYTNNPPAGAMRGFGVPQVTFAIEGLLDVLAERVGLDGWEIRWRNALDVGDRFTTGQVLGPGVGLKRTLLAVRDAYRSARYAGIACGAKNTGIGNGMAERGRAILRPERDGSFTLHHSWTEMGQGIHTALRQIAAHELGVPPERIRVVVDTERELDTGETTASRATVLGGEAVRRAARALRSALDTARHEDLVGRDFAGEYVVDWTTSLEQEAEDPVTHISYGWATQVVLLDDEGRLERVIAAQDVGRAINRQAVEGQVEGGVHMGLGYALSEEYRVAEGRPQTDTLKSLNIIPAAGMPPVDVILVEEPQPDGPYGAKGAGEAVLVPTAAAVAGALHAFDGVRRRALPMTDSAAARAAVPKLARVERVAAREAEEVST